MLLAEVCSLMPSNLLRTMLNVPLKANLMNSRLDRMYGRYEGTAIAEVSGEIREFQEFCAKCEASLENLFGPLG